MLMFLRFIYDVTYICNSFLLLSNTILLHEHAKVCLCIPQSTVGLFPVFPIIENAIVNIRAQGFVGHKFSFLLVMYPRVELLGHMVTLLPPFEEQPNSCPFYKHV